MKTKKSLQYDDWLQQKLVKQKEEKCLQQKRAAELEEIKRKTEEKRKKEREIRYQDWSERKSRAKKSKEGITNELKGLKKFYSNDLVSPESNFNAWLKKKTTEQKANEQKKLLEKKLKEEQLESRKRAAQEAYEKWLLLKNLESKHQKLVEKKHAVVDDEIKISHRGYQSTRSEISYSALEKFKKKRAFADKAAHSEFIITAPLMEYDEDVDDDETAKGSQTYRKSPKQQNSFRKIKKSIAIINKNYQKHGLYNPPKKRFSNLAKKICKSPPLSA